LRAERGWSQDDLAKAALGTIERAEQSIGLDNMKKITEAFVKSNPPAGAVPVAARTADAMRHRARIIKTGAAGHRQIKSKGYTG